MGTTSNPFITATSAKMTKRTKKVGVTGKYGTRYVTNLLSARRAVFARSQKHNFENNPPPSTIINLSTARNGLEGRKNRHRSRALTISRHSDTVPPSESKSRRWKSLNTPNMSAHSAERPPSRDILSESGTASRATRPSLEEHTLCQHPPPLPGDRRFDD